MPIPRSSTPPTDLRTRRRFDFTDASQLNELLGGPEQIIIQKGIARGIGQWVEVDMETIRFQRVEPNMPWIRSVAPLQQWLTIIIPLCTGPHPIFNGCRVQPAQVAMIGPGAERFEIVKKNTSGKYFEIAVYTGRLHMEYLRAFGTTAPDITDICEVIDIPEGNEDWLQSVEAMGSMVTAASATGIPAAADLDAALIHIVLQSLRVVADLELRRGTVLADRSERKHRDALWHCRQYIHDHIHETLSIEELSEASGYSERQLQYLFKLRLGLAPLAYVRHYRFQKARDALKIWAGSVKEAALSCGFSELGRFSVKYRSVFGESPNETLRLRTAPRASGLGGASSVNRTSDQNISIRAESKISIKNASAEALEAGWRSGAPSFRNRP